MTILDTCISILDKANEPLSADVIYEEIIKNNLYSFSAKDPKAILHSTIRKHIKNNKTPLIVEINKGTYKKA